MFNENELRIFKRLLQDDLESIQVELHSEMKKRNRPELNGYWQEEFRKIEKLKKKVEEMLND